MRTRFTRIDTFDEVDSTNRVARDEGRAGAPEGLVLVAEHQSAGRGRQGRSWEAPAGTALLVSVLLRPSLPAAELHLVTAAVALAARDACSAAAGVDPAIKWPNDLLVADAKLAGILAESSGGAVVVGMGMNVTSHPEGATSLAASGWGRPDREALLAELLLRLDGYLDRWPQVSETYRGACATVGRRVRAELPGGAIVGVAESIDVHGHLVVVPEAGGEPVVLSAADVVHLRTG